LIEQASKKVSEILGVPIDAVEVIINEVSKANWGKGGVQVEEPPSSDQKRTQFSPGRVMVCPAQGACLIKAKVRVRGWFRDV